MFQSSRKVKIKFLTYGCKVNRYETEKIRQELLRGGAADAGDGQADYYLINSCTVTSTVDSEIAREARKLKKQGKKIILTGCRVTSGASGNEELLALADHVIPNEKKLDVSAYNIPGIEMTAVEDEVLRGFSDREKAFVKAEDGCPNSCAYCVIPSVRGRKVASRDASEIAREIETLSANGFREIVLTGVNLGMYKGLAGMLRTAIAAASKTGTRLRLSSIGPKELTDEIIEIAAASGGTVCPHFHLSMQSGDDTVLKMMNRNYDTALYAARVEKILSLMPGAAITTDIIAGFPGETEAMHRNTVEFVKKMPLSRLHVFPYSDRPGTAASAMKEKVDPKVKKQRVKELAALGAEKADAFMKKFINRELTVLVEENGEGYTENYIRVKVKGDAVPGSLQKVVIKEGGVGEIISAGRRRQKAKV